MQSMERRRFLGLLTGTLSATATGALSTNSLHAAVPSFVAFGDSYTVSVLEGIPGWPTLIRNDGSARLLANMALRGSSAEGTNTPRTFDGQVDAWLAKHKGKGVPDRAVVYFGYNDVKLRKPLTAAKNEYRRQVDRLIAQGVTQGKRKLVLCLIHDWSRNPGADFPVRSRVIAWNNHIRSLAAARPNCVTVDLFARFEDVFKRPSAYGIVNLTDWDHKRSFKDYLFGDDEHFGKVGQAIIARDIMQQLL